MALGHQHGSWWLSRPWATTWPFVAAGITDADSDLDYCKATDPDTAPGSSPGHPDQHGSGGGTNQKATD